MGLYDKLTELQQQNNFSAGKRTSFLALNGKRTRLCHVLIEATVNVTTIGTTVYNDGDALSLVDFIGINQGGSSDVVNFPGLLLRHMAELLGPGFIPRTPLTVAQAGALGTYTIKTAVPINLAFPGLANMSETYWAEVNQLNAVTVFITQATAGLANLTDALGTFTLTATVTQTYDDDRSNLPYFVAYLDFVDREVSAANPQMRFDLRSDDYMAAILLRQYSDKGEVADAVTSLSYLGDSAQIIGPAQVGWDALVDAMADQSGGAAAYLSDATRTRSWWGWNHLKNGRLSALVPPFQLKNLRLLASVAPTAKVGATTTNVQVARFMVMRNPAVTNPNLPPAMARALGLAPIGK